MRTTVAGRVFDDSRLADEWRRVMAVVDDGADTVVFERGDAEVRLYMSDQLAHVDADETIRELALHLTTEGVGALVVLEDGVVRGVVSERDVARALAAGSDPDTTTAAEIASREPLTCPPDATVAEAAAEMMSHYVRHLVVHDGERAVGVVSARDLLGAYTS